MSDRETKSNLFDILDKLLDVKRAFLWKVAEKHNLTALQIQILRFIQKCAPHGKVIANTIARELYVTRATMSVALAALEKKGLIQKTSAAQDKRTHYLSLAGRAEDILQETEEFSKALASHLSKFPKKSIRAVTVILTQLLALMQDEGIVDHVTMCINCNHCVRISKTSFQCELTGRTFSYDAVKIGCCNFRQTGEASYGWH